MSRALTGPEVGLYPPPEEEIPSHCTHSHSACSYSHHCCCARRSFTASINLAQEVKLILKEIRCEAEVERERNDGLCDRYMTRRLREKDEEDITITDWKFAAMVIDRFCLIGLTIYTILTTLVMFISAPHLIVK